MDYIMTVDRRVETSLRKHDKIYCCYMSSEIVPVLTILADLHKEILIFHTRKCVDLLQQRCQIFHRSYNFCNFLINVMVIFICSTRPRGLGIR